MAPIETIAPRGFSQRSVLVRRKDEKVATPKKAIVGEKVGMTQLWTEDNRVVPVTVLRVPSLRVVQVKTPSADGYAAIQVTYGQKKAKALSKPAAGHFAKAEVEPGAKLLELRLEDTSEYEVGQELTVTAMEKGERVDVTATSKGKGHAGVMKRHNFRGQGGGHGNHLNHRTPGSIGACATPGRVFKGLKMAGRMGGERVTTLGLEVVDANEQEGLLLVKGAVPGPRGGTVIIRNAVKGNK